MFATLWLACGKAAAENGWGKRAVANGKVTILPNAIDPERFKFDVIARKQIREQYGIADDDFVVGHVGRFYPQKNHTFLIDLFAELCKVSPNSKLLLLGDGPLQTEIQRKVEMLGLSNKVVFAGLQKDPAPFYSAMDIFCFPSLWEGLPLTLVETQYNGLGVVVADTITSEVVVSNKVLSLHIKETHPWVAELVKKNTRVENVVCRVDNDRFDIRKCYGVLELLYKTPKG